MLIKEAIQLAIDDHRAYARGCIDYEYVDALQKVLELIKTLTREITEEEGTS